MARQYQVRTGPIQNDAAPFSIDMVAGNRPDRPRLFSTRNALGLMLSQPTHTAAAFSIEMVAGHLPTSPLRPRAHEGWSSSQPTFVVAGGSVVGAYYYSEHIARMS